MSVLVDLTENESNILAGVLVHVYRKMPAHQADCRVIARKLNIEAKFQNCLSRQMGLKFEEKKFDPNEAKVRKVREDIF